MYIHSTHKGACIRLVIPEGEGGGTPVNSLFDCLGPPPIPSPPSSLLEYLDTLPPLLGESNKTFPLYSERIMCMCQYCNLRTL